MASQKPTPFIRSVLSSLPSELVIKVLDCLLEDTILAFSGGIFEPVVPTYTPPEEIHLFPQPFLAEVPRLLHRRWLQTEKAFEDLWDYSILHILLANRHDFVIPPELVRYATPAATLPPFMNPHPTLSLHGLERIRLSLSSQDYFAFFRVRVPPFEDHNLLEQSPESFHAAAFLQYTKELTIDFGTLYRAVHPWYDLAETPWDLPSDGGVEPRFLPNVCTAGLVVDWILTYAWHNKFIQHIPIVRITGDVQPWVLEKWTQILGGTHPRQESIGTLQEIHALSRRGENDATRLGAEWRPEDHYPPRCKCEVACWGLQDGRVLPEIVPIEGGWNNKEFAMPLGPSTWRKDCKELREAIDENW